MEGQQEIQKQFRQQQEKYMYYLVALCVASIGLTVQYVPLRHVERQIKGMLYPFRCNSRYIAAQSLLRYAFQNIHEEQ